MVKYEDPNFDLTVRVKLLEDKAVLPSSSKDDDGAMDLTANSKFTDENGNFCFGTGLAMEIPNGYVGLIFPRSSVSKYKLDLANAVGVVDAGYRGEIMRKFKPTLTFNDDLVDLGGLDRNYQIGERVAQIMIIPRPRVQFIESTELSDSDRGEGGFGSTGS